MSNSKFLVRENLEIYIPSLFDLINGQNISWRDISKKFQKKHEERIKLYEEGNYHLVIEVNFYDLITKVMKDDPQSIIFLKYFDFVFKDLNSNLSQSGKSLVSKIIRSLLNDFTLGYLHYLGELSVLNNLLKTSYTLDCVEFTIKNGKKIDFRLISVKDNNPILVEVMNIHINEETPRDHNTLEKFLQGKIVDKITDKTKTVSDDFNFFLIPVLWGSSSDLQMINEFYNNGPGIHFKQVLEPYTYSNYYDQEKGQYILRFHKISSLIDH